MTPAVQQWLPPRAGPEFPGPGAAAYPEDAGPLGFPMGDGSTPRAFTRG